MLKLVRKRAATGLGFVRALVGHHLFDSERRREAAPFFQAYPYRGEMPLRRVDRHSVVDTEAGYLFHRIPKAANTVFSASLMRYRHNGSAAFGGHGDMRAAKSGLRNVSSLSEEETARVAGLFKFAIVRDPYARLLSAYLSKAQFLEGKRRSKPRVVTGKAPDWTSDPSFDVFCRYLADGGLHYNAHWTPQLDYLLFPVERYDFVGRVETLADDFAAVCERLFPGRGPFELVREDSRHATGSRARMDEFYTPELYRLVGALYARDFEAFGYSG